MNNMSLLGRIAQDVVLESNEKTSWVKNALLLKENNETFFFDFIAFGNNAIYLNKYTEKGKRVLLNGSLKCEQWIDKTTNTKKTKYLLNVKEVTIIDYKEQEKQEEQINEWFYN